MLSILWNGWWSNLLHQHLQYMNKTLLKKIKINSTNDILCGYLHYQSSASVLGLVPCRYVLYLDVKKYQLPSPHGMYWSRPWKYKYLVLNINKQNMSRNNTLCCTYDSSQSPKRTKISLYITVHVYKVIN